MESKSTQGGCFCGAIRYEFTSAQYTVAECHCSMCRKTSGAPYVAWVVVPKSDFAYTKGAPVKLQSSKAGSRFFCGKCGTPVVCISTNHPDIVDVTVGSLDDPENFSPTMTIFEDSRLPWVHREETS